MERHEFQIVLVRADAQMRDAFERVRDGLAVRNKNLRRELMQFHKLFKFLFTIIKISNVRVPIDIFSFLLRPHRNELACVNAIRRGFNPLRRTHRTSISDFETLDFEQVILNPDMMDAAIRPITAGKRGQ